MSNDKESSFSELSAKDDVKIIEPDYSLKKMIGENIDLKQVFSAENISRAQDVIETHKDDFLEWVKGDLAAMEDHYSKAVADIPHCKDDVTKLAKIAFVIKAQAGTFGFSLGTAVAKSLDDFCNRDFIASAEHLTVIRKHIDTLKVIFAKKITGDGASMGTELMGNLQKLVTKYQATK